MCWNASSCLKCWLAGRLLKMRLVAMGRCTAHTFEARSHIDVATVFRNLQFRFRLPLSIIWDPDLVVILRCWIVRPPRRTRLTGENIRLRTAWRVASSLAVFRMIDADLPCWISVNRFYPSVFSKSLNRPNVYRYYVKVTTLAFCSGIILDWRHQGQFVRVCNVLSFLTLALQWRLWW